MARNGFWTAKFEQKIGNRGAILEKEKVTRKFSLKVAEIHVFSRLEICFNIEMEPMGGEPAEESIMWNVKALNHSEAA